MTIETTLAAALPCVIVSLASAGGIQIQAPFDADYSVAEIGQVPGVPFNYGGVTFKPGDPNVLVIGGAANSSGAQVYEIAVTRGCTGSISGFDGTATVLSTAPQIDGGLAYGPDDVLFYATYPNNTLGQIMPGSAAPDRVINLADFGVTGSTGTLQVVPDGFAAAGRIKILTYTLGGWYDAGLTPDGNGTFDLVDLDWRITIPGGPEGVVFIPAGTPQFNVDSAVVSEYDVSRVAVYDLDGLGDPIDATRRDFLTGLAGVIGGTRDPLTGDFLFSQYGADSSIVVVRGFGVDCPGDLDDDGLIGINDLLMLLAAWGSSCTDEDLNDDTVVDVGDLLILLGGWGPCS